MSSSNSVNNNPLSTPVPSDDNNNLAQALAAIQTELNDELQWIQKMKDDADAIAKDKQDIANAYHHHHSGWWIFTDTYTTIDHSAINNANSDIASKTADIKDLEAKLNAAGFKDLDQAIDRLLQGLNDAQGNVKVNVDGSVDRFRQDITQITGFLDAIFQAMMQRAYLNADLKEAQADDGSGKVDLQALVFDSISKMQAINSILTKLESDADGDSSQYNTDSNNAQVEKNGVHWWNEWFGNGYETEAKDNNIIDNANMMMKLIANLEHDLAPALVSSSGSDFMQIAMTINTIIKKILAILNDKSIPPDEKKADLKQLAMELFVIVMGLIGLVDQMANKDKNQSDADMSKANGQAAQMGIVSQQAQQRMLEQNKEYAHIMGIIMKVAEFTVGIALAAATGGAAGCLMAAITVADAAFDLTSKLAEACGGGVGGAVAAAAIEMVLTCGVGSAMETGAKVAMEAATATVKTAVETMLKDGLKTVIKEAVEQAAKTAVDASEAAVKEGVQVVEKTAVEAAETAAKKVFDQIFRENGLSIIFKALKEGVLIRGTEALEAMAKPAMEQAAKEAAEASIKESTQLMTTLGKVADFTAEEAKQFSKVAEDAANEAVANVRNITVKQAEKIPSYKSVISYGVKAAAIGAMYGIAQTHLTTEIAKKIGDDDETLKMILGILDQIMIMASAMLSGNFDYSMEGIMGLMVRGARVAQMAGMGAEVYSNEQMWETQRKEGDATSNIGMIQSGLDVLNTMVQPSINNRQKDGTQQDSKDAEFAFQTTSSLAADLWKYADSAARALQA